MIETEIKLLELELKTVIAELLDSKNFNKKVCQELDDRRELIIDKLNKLKLQLQDKIEHE